MGHRQTYRAPKLMPLEKRLMLDASLPIIAGQVLWLDAADATTIRDADGDNAATGTGGAGNGFSGSVATWVDKSTSGFNVTNATPTQQPSYTLGALNGRNVVTLDGSTDRLINTTAVIAGNDYTAFIVFNRTTATARDAVFELGGGGSRNGLFVNDGGSGRLGFYANSAFFNSTNVYTAGTFEVVTMIHDVNAINMWRNNSSQVSATGSARASTTGIYIGDDSTTGDQLQGNIAEFIVYDRDLSADERRDVENYLASKWGLTLASNTTPVLGVNTGATVSQSDPVTITSAMLASTDADNSESILRYTITDLADYGTLTNTNTSHVYALGEFFTQADIDAGYIQYTHDGTANFTDSFSFTVSDLYSATAGATFNLTITPDNQAPVLQGWTLVSAEDFEGGASGWSINTSESSYPYLTRFLGRYSNEGGAQNVFKTYTLSGSQDFTILTFDFYRLDSWDNEQFRIFIDDVIVFNQAFTPAYTVIPDGSFGSVSWTVQEVTGTAPNFVYGTWGDQIMRFTMRIDNNAATDVKIGFSSTTNQATSDESWGVDNLNIYEVSDSGIPGPLHIVEGMANGTVLGTVTARDPDVGDTLAYSITGGTGAGIFSIDSATGVITLTNTSVVDYETTTSYTLTVRVTDNGTPSYFDEETITINVLDRPENTAPTINALGPLSMSEATANGTVLGTITGNDADGDTITWSITNGNTDNIFSINSTTGAIRVNNNANLNYEWDTSYTLTIQARDNGWANLTSTRNVTINITDVNEAPTFNIPQSFMNENPYLRYNATTGNFYRYVGTGANFATASANAAGSLLNGVAGHIATITSAAENAYVRSLGSGSLWLSASDSVVEGEWRWIGGGTEDGEMFWLGGAAGSAQGGYYTNWASSQPSSATEDNIEMFSSGQWNDVTATGNRAYVIEWEGADVLAALGNGPYTLAENPALNQSVGFVHARDADAGDVLTYSVTGGTGAAHFAINASTGEITVTNPSAINYETATSFTLDVRVQDTGGLFSTQTVTIDITDVNEAPVLAAHAPVTIPENIALNTVVADMDATDVDAGQTLTYSITGGNGAGIFAINGGNGQIRIANLNNLNYETGTVYNLTIRATDNGTGSLFDTEVVTINISDVNEAPSFDPVQRLLNNDPGLRYNATTGNFYRYINTTANYANATIAANATLLNGVGGYIATVGNAAENAYITSLISATSWLGGNDIAVEGEWRWADGENANDMFWLGTGAGSAQNGLYTNWNGAEPNNSGGNEDALEIRTNGLWNDINAGSTRSYVIEWDGAAVLSSLQNGPYVFGENAAIGFSPGSATAGDPDIGDVLTYSITGGSGVGVFQINGATGQITLIDGVNYEVQNSYTLDLRVEDSTGLFDTVTVTLTVTDENDVPSLLTLTGNHIVENSPLDTMIGTLSTSDEDPADTHIYSLVTNPGGKFVIVNGNEIRTLGDIDYEQNQSFSVVVRTNDGNGGILDRTFLITVGDVMDTFTPPPATGGSGGSDIFIPADDQELEASGNLLRSAFGAEEGQSSAFYGQGFRQYLRENVTFEVRDILNTMNVPDDRYYGDSFMAANEDTPVGLAPQQDASVQKFTNIREALMFLQQIADSQTSTEQGGQEAGDQADEVSRNLPQSAIDRQFVDVMTYHEERAARLREALLAG